MYVVLCTSSSLDTAAISKVLSSKKEADKLLQSLYSKNIEISGIYLSKDRSYCKDDIAYISNKDGSWLRFEVKELEVNTNPSLKNVIFDGWSTEEVQDKANKFLENHPNINIVDAELSTSLETTPASHYYKVTYAIIYQEIGG